MRSDSSWALRPPQERAENSLAGCGFDRNCARGADRRHVRHSRSPGPLPIANRADRRGFQGILREVPKLLDWVVERGGFELSLPSSNG